MIIEYIRYVLVVHDPDSLITAYTEAGRHLAAAPECLGYDLGQCTDDPKSFILRIRWTSAEAHMEGFRHGPHFAPFLSVIRPFIDEIAEMRHYGPTAVEWMR